MKVEVEVPHVETIPARQAAKGSVVCLEGAYYVVVDPQGMAFDTGNCVALVGLSEGTFLSVLKDRKVEPVDATVAIKRKSQL